MVEPDIEAVRRLAGALGIELTGDRAEQLAEALHRYLGQLKAVDRLDFQDREPSVSDPADGR